jgi:hypothetical protein
VSAAILDQAIDAGPKYFAEYLSENIAQTPEGFLICRNAVIGRTGYQTYLVRELAANDPDGLVRGLDPGMSIEVWRDPAEVFSPATLASFESKSFTINHPPQMLTPETDGSYSVGHIQNVHQGDQPLDDGNLPMLADVIVKAQEAIDAILVEKLRKLSCGYFYKLSKTGNRYEQRNIRGNHLALVLNPRAGHEAQINDEAPGGRIETVTAKQLIVLGLKKVFGETEDPTKLAAAFDEAVAGVIEPPQSQLDAAAEKEKMEKEKEAADKKARDDKRAKDDAEEKEKKEREEKEAADKKAKDDKAAKDAAEEEERKKKEAEDKKKGGKDASEHRAKMHSALDKILDRRDEKAKMEDVNMGELETLLSEYFEEESEEPEHQGDGEEVMPISDAEMCDEPEDKEKEKEKKGEKDSEIVRPEPHLAPGEVPQSQLDAAILEGQLAMLNNLRPMIVASGDANAKKFFNEQLGAVTAARKKSGGTPGSSYSLVRTAAGRLSAGATDSMAKTQKTAAQKAQEWDEMYAKEREKRSRKKKTAA